MDGKTSDMEVAVREFAMVLAVASGLPVWGTDERLTTQSAESILLAQDRSIKEMKARRDSAAACILLQDFVNSGGQGERIA
jgi:putative transcription antitermination factor YqgF